jgi:ribonuclease Z
MEKTKYCLDSKEMNNYLWSVWNLRNDYELNKNYKLNGYSIAAFRTNFMIKSLNIMFDAGLSSPLSFENIFITHGHCDHTASINFHIYNANKIVNIYMPNELIDNMGNFLKYSMQLSTLKTFDESKVEYKLIGVKENDNFDIYINKKRFNISIFNCYHNIPCVGYGISEYKNKLKEEYVGMKKEDIMELKKKNIVFTEEVLDNFIVYLGDTTEKVFENNEIFKYTNIMVECTFILESDYEQSIQTSHIHWLKLKEIIKNNPKNIFILYHFSRRYKKSFLLEFFENIKEEYGNIIAWIHD